jgi:hypothetical protein
VLFLSSWVKQYAGNKHFHQIAIAKRDHKIGKSHVKNVTHHGKSSSDGESNDPKQIIKEGMRSGHLVDPGTRELALYLAQARHAPVTPGSKKRGWWASDMILFGYFSDKALKAAAAFVPEAEPIEGSMKMHFMVGLGIDAAACSVLHKEEPCFCKPCDFPLFEFGKCELVARGLVPGHGLAKCEEKGGCNSSRSSKQRQACMVTFRKALKPGNFCAVRIDKNGTKTDDADQEFWVVQLKSEFYHVQQGGFSRGSGLQAGNAAVDAVWLDCVDTENMRYQYVGGEARDDQIQQLHLDMFVGIPSLRPWAHTDNRGLAGGGVLFSMSDQCHREILEHM